MKILFSIILTFLIYTRAYQQAVVVANDKMNVFYKGISNPLSIAVENYPCNKIIVQSNCGTLKYQKDSCHYDFTADSSCYIANFQIGIYDSNKIKWISEQRFRVKRIPDPTAFICGMNRGYIDKYMLSSCSAILPMLLNFDFELYFVVNKYSFSILRNDSIISEKKQIIGNRLTKEVIDEILKTKSNDVVLFYDISVMCLDKIERTINTIELTIK